MKGPTLLAIGAAFATGIGLGYLLAARDEAPVRTSVRTAAPAPPPDSSLRTEPTSAQSFLDSVPLPRIPEGDGRITGRVRTDAGESVAGVTIDARSLAEAHDYSEWPKEPNEQLLRVAESVKWHAALHRSAKTMADGTFLLEGVPDLAYRLEGKLPGWRIRAVNRDGAQEVRPGADVEFVAERVVVVRATVLFPDGVAPTRATITARQGENSSNWSDRNGVAEISLRPGEWEIWATAGESGEFASEPETVTLAGESAEMTLRLRGRPGIVGRIVIEWGKPLGDPEVKCVPLAAGVAPAPSQLEAQGERVRVTREGDESRFCVIDLAPGRYLLGVFLVRSGPGQHPWQMEVVDVGDSLVVRDLVLPEPPRSAYALVQVLDPTGAPVADLAFSGGFSGDRLKAAGPVAALRRPDGSYLALHYDVPAQADGRVADGKNSITLRSRTYGDRKIDYTRGPADEFRIRFAPPATLVVTLTGFTGVPPQSELGMLLRAPLTPEERAMKSRSYTGNRAKPDARGRFSIGPAEAGSHEIVIFHAQRIGLGVVVATVAVTLQPGENRLDLPMPAMHSLKVRTGGKAGVQVQLQPADAEAEWFLTYQNSDASGTAEFPAVAPGRYRVSAGKPEPVIVEVSGPTEIAVDG